MLGLFLYAETVITKKLILLIQFELSRCKVSIEILKKLAGYKIIFHLQNIRKS